MGRQGSGGDGPAAYFIREAEVARLTGLSRAWRYLLEREGRFPAARRIGRRGKAWVRAEVLCWLESRPVVSSSEAA